MKGQASHLQSETAVLVHMKDPKLILAHRWDNSPMEKKWLYQAIPYLTMCIQILLQFEQRMFASVDSLISL